MAIVGKWGLIVAEATLRGAMAADEFPRFLSSFETIYAPKIGQPRKAVVFRRGKSADGQQALVLPRTAIPALRSLGIRVEARWDPLETEVSTPSLDFLYDHQQLLVAHIAQRLRARSIAALNLRAGYGKSFIGAGIILTLNQRAIYIVPTRELCAQICKDIGHVFEVAAPAHTISADWRPGRPEAPPHVLVLVINTALTARLDMALFPIVIFDEMHAYCTNARSSVFWDFQTRYMFGMSATTADRRDGFDFIAHRHLGAPIMAESVPGFTYGESQFRLHVRLIYYAGPPSRTRNLRHEATGRVFTHYMHGQFIADEERNRVVVAEVARLLDLGHSLYVFCEERAHAEKLAALITVTCDTLPALFYGNPEESDRQRALADSQTRVIVATYAFAGTGISIVRMTALVFATPRYAGMKQILGRIMRLGSDPLVIREVADIVDSRTCMRSQLRFRREAYDFYGAEYEKIRVAAREEDD